MDTSWLPAEKVPVKMTPEQAFAKGMRVRDYAQLEHGRLHRDRVEKLRQLWNQKRAETVPAGHLPLDTHQAALILVTLYEHHAAYSMNTQSQIQAEGYYKAFLALGGTY